MTGSHPKFCSKWIAPLGNKVACPGLMVFIIKRAPFSSNIPARSVPFIAMLNSADRGCVWGVFKPQGPRNPTVMESPLPTSAGNVSLRAATVWPFGVEAETAAGLGLKKSKTSRRRKGGWDGQPLLPKSRVLQPCRFLVQGAQEKRGPCLRASRNCIWNALYWKEFWSLRAVRVRFGCFWDEWKVVSKGPFYTFCMGQLISPFRLDDKFRLLEIVTREGTQCLLF